MDTQTTKCQPAPGVHLDLSWLPPIGMIGLSVANFVYRLLTLGIYDFWARTEVRKRLWSAIRLDGEPLVYTGTGKELFLGFLIVFGVVLLPILFVSVAAILVFGPNSAAANLVQAAIYLGVVVLFGLGIYRAQRYRLLRTSWRGIRGSLEGRSMPYATTYFLTMLLIPVTLGWIIPWRTTKLQSMITNDARFGSEPFAFRGSSGPLYAPFAVLWFGVLALFFAASMISGIVIGTIQGALGPGGEPSEAIKQVYGLALLAVFALAYLFYLFMSAWYRARTINHFADCTFIDNARFNGRLTGAGLLWIDLTNLAILAAGSLIVMALAVAIGGLIVTIAGTIVPAGSLTPDEVTAYAATIAAPLLVVITVLSFTLLLPVTQARSMGYLINNLSLEGTLDVDKISQSTADPMATGEGLAQAFDVDAF
ncbi:MAG: hypothetical protein APF80_05130 [Alphaproteobacteria bacterium BRH_c36]|nr:MAG: hypothetical protein APF80_05130 [Alphaproteobacteria bacterium BRH_c36]